jgi:hypothetical protein
MKREATSTTAYHGYIFARQKNDTKRSSSITVPRNIACIMSRPIHITQTTSQLLLQSKIEIPVEI